MIRCQCAPDCPRDAAGRSLYARGHVPDGMRRRSNAERAQLMRISRDEYGELARRLLVRAMGGEFDKPFSASGYMSGRRAKARAAYAAYLRQQRKPVQSVRAAALQEAC